MAKRQYWEIVLDGQTHRLTYTRRALRATVTLDIDGTRFELPRGEREEPFRLGDEQAILGIDRHGRASIRTRHGLAEEHRGAPTVDSDSETVAAPHAPAKPVLLIFKTHLDVGFTDLAANVRERYLNEFIPNAIRVGYELKDTDTPFRWTVGSWLIHEALKNDTDGKVEQAIRDGILNWHALPFTTHTELMNETLFEYGLNVSAALDARFGRRTTAAKMTDVPGHTLGMVPHLASHGVKLLHIGVNPATPLPPVPPLFRWRCGESEITVIYQGDYGAAAEFDDFYLYFAHTNDNCGPQSADEIVAIYDKVKSLYPSSPVRAATLCDVAEMLGECDDLPVIEGEIGDTWIHGAATDPQKLSRLRALQRHIAAQGVGEVDLCDHLLLVPEHTWGMDMKTFFHNETDFTPEQMARCAEARAQVETSWREQRGYVENAEAALGVTPEMPARPVWEDATALSLEGLTLPVEISWQLFDRTDYERYMTDYMRLTDGNRPWAIWDFTKVGLPEYQGGIYTATVKAAYERDGECLYRLAFDLDDERARMLGLPELYLRVEGERYELQWFGKQPSRLPQACWLKFKGMDESWEMHKMGQWIRPHDVIGSPFISAVDDGVRNATTHIRSLDAALVAPFGRRLLQYQTDVSELAEDLYFNLYNNIWNTNFPMWYEDDAIFRFTLVPR